MRLLEIIGFNINACLTAELAGASRIELCANPGGGGTTPSYGFIKAAIQLLKIPVFVMIRPREGDFLYSAEEFDLMQTDIAQCRQLGCKGIVTGILAADGSVDKQRMSVLIKNAEMEVTFHRAFDRVKDHQSALEDIIALGCTRILTSGGKPTAEEGLERIHELIRQADKRIIIMPGSGIRSGNILKIAEASGAIEFHSSAGYENKGAMIYNNALMNEELTYADVNRDEIESMIRKLRNTEESTIQNFQHENT